MAEKYIVGLDNGTTGVKAKIYDLKGNVISEGYREYDCVYLKPGWVDQDVNMLMESNYEALKDAVSHSNVDPADMASLGLSTQRALHLYVDEEGKVLRNGMGISWQDARHPEQIQWMRDRIGEEKFYSITGLPIGAFWSVGKIRWVMENEPEVFETADKILLTQEYFLYHLGARDGWFQDWSNGSLYGLMDIERFEWSDELCEDFGILESKLPTLVPSAHRVGAVDEYCHQRTGLPVGMPICTGGGDQQCAGVGAGIIEEGLCEITFGTAGNSVAYLESPKYDPQRKITCSAHALNDAKWEAEGIQAAAGGSYRWFRDTIGYMARHIEPFTRTDPYVWLNNLASETPPGSRGLIFHPYLSGSMSPHYDPSARAGFLGLTFKHDTGCLARAVMEGVAFEARDIFDAYAAMGLELHEIRLSGGATKSPLWSQIQADIYGRPTVVLKEGECAVLGAAILGAVGAEVFRSVEEGCAEMVHVESTLEPNPMTRDQYDELHEIFKDAYCTMANNGVYKELAVFQSKYG